MSLGFKELKLFFFFFYKINVILRNPQSFRKEIKKKLRSNLFVRSVITKLIIKKMGQTGKTVISNTNIRKKILNLEFGISLG